MIMQHPCMLAWTVVAIRFDWTHILYSILVSSKEAPALALVIIASWWPVPHVSLHEILE